MLMDLLEVNRMLVDLLEAIRMLVVPRTTGWQVIQPVTVHKKAMVQSIRLPILSRLPRRHRLPQKRLPSPQRIRQRVHLLLRVGTRW